MRSLINQFELPVLFYVCCLTLFVLNAAGTAAVLLAWGFALSRLVPRLCACDEQPASAAPSGLCRRFSHSGRYVGDAGLAARGGGLKCFF